MRTRWKRLRSLARVLGVWTAIKYLLYKKGVIRSSEFWIQPKHVAYPLGVRDNSSDIDVFDQIFVQREYACLDDMVDVGLVLDCGANVGYSTAYFLSKHPHCQVVAVEPDPDNFAVLQRNLSAYGTRTKLIRAGIWSHTAQLVISRDKYRDGREWTKQVRECGPGEVAEIEGIDVRSILADSEYERISLLKMDVEGAEAVVFSESSHSWLDKVDAIAIELHDDSFFGNATEVFLAAINGQGFQLSQSGELTICRRPGPTNR